ncbi:hypothetical protein B0T14DRAFT_248138 [Immersiella caudata]|uniref:Uncharacterized protein n=1 Tax=Immersiella caudata TaxID=314043 RepID=A0AA39WJG4_9PEZI|nr:hypothetical protein B0T14DRAFT_248138 [Immersiella caudata]
MGPERRAKRCQCALSRYSGPHHQRADAQQMELWKCQRFAWIPVKILHRLPICQFPIFARDGRTKLRHGPSNRAVDFAWKIGSPAIKNSLPRWAPSIPGHPFVRSSKASREARSPSLHLPSGRRLRDAPEEADGRGKRKRVLRILCGPEPSLVRQEGGVRSTHRLKRLERPGRHPDPRPLHETTSVWHTHLGSPRAPKRAVPQRLDEERHHTPSRLSFGRRVPASKVEGN